MKKPQTKKTGTVRVSPTLGAYLRRTESDASKPNLLQRLVKPGRTP